MGEQALEVYLDCIMKLITILCISLFITLTAQAQCPDTARYELIKNMPTYYEQMKAQLTWPLAWRHCSELSFNDWRAKARQKLDSCLLPVPPAPATYDMQVMAREQRQGYQALKITFNLTAWSRIPAYLLIPDGEGPFPAIVMLHDHGAHFTIGKEKMIRPFGVSAEVIKDADEWVVKCYDGQYVGDYYAAHGYVVLAIDALFWNERGRKEGADYDGQQAFASNLMQMGMNWAGVMTYDDLRSVEFLASLPQVDKECIGALGFSMGAHRAWMLAALTDLVKASAAVCWMNTTEYLMTLTNNQNRGGSAYAMLVPGLRLWMDYPDVASIACPKPMLFFNGSRDKLFPLTGAQDAYRILREVWEGQGAGDRLVTKIWDSSHFFSKAMQKETLEFFGRQF